MDINAWTLLRNGLAPLAWDQGGEVTCHALFRRVHVRLAHLLNSEDANHIHEALGLDLIQTADQSLGLERIVYFVHGKAVVNIEAAGGGSAYSSGHR